MSIFAYSILAGLAPLLSSSIPFFTLRNRNINASVFHILLCISAGLLFAVASLELIPESMNLALRSFEESTKTQTSLKSTTTKTTTTTTTIGNIKLQKSFISNSEDSLNEFHSLDNEINKPPIEGLNLNNLNQATNLDNNEEDNDNLDNDGENEIENDHDHDHQEDEGGDNDHDHESEEKKEFLKIPMYGIGFGFAILIIVESIFSSIDGGGGGGGHHSHSHGSLSSSSSNDVISDYISNNNSNNINNNDDDNNNNNNNNDDDDDSVELLERNVVNKDNSNNINNINNNNDDEDIIVINKSIENTPNIASPVMNKDNNNNDKDKNRNSNKSDIKNSGSINNGNNSGNNNNNNKSKLTITTFIALSIHSFVDGVVISSAFSSSPHVGARVALAIVIHKIPDGLVLSSLILSQKKFNSGIFSNPFFYFLLISCMTPLGSFISSFLFGGLSLSSGAFVLGFGAGTFIYITSTAILPEILSNQIVKKSTSLFSIFLGYLLFIFLDSQFHGAH
ncbi:zinc/iron permease [Dictyostelium discoideum AX4]|uniref:Protein zntA n=1 Tax=Dictyostelium discoideum TaxID=44689 RepID=ZNTA_DICDI|nr:zinc/iron permease [Dictyostelium discoideum AX4]Q55FL1.2 RecName: Full=Protein zntA; Flags: Precursor [Dictyostelium discoideum]EAL73666.2 zinc/iron permease [Dictyostelium discoideum AX4]|eukprot:XP_647522.2 zinc/iron permease [Dictyostelium discoideum AX4]